VLASEHIVFTEAALSAFTGQPVSSTPEETPAPKRRASKPKAESAAQPADGAEPASEAAETAEPKAPRRRTTTPKEGEEQ
jgi:hypothetical protein